MFKSYVSGDRLLVDVVQGDCFFPTTFDTTGRLTGRSFEQLKRKNTIYTRLERHDSPLGCRPSKQSVCQFQHGQPGADPAGRCSGVGRPTEVRIEWSSVKHYFRIPLPAAMTGTARWGPAFTPPPWIPSTMPTNSLAACCGSTRAASLPHPMWTLALRPTGDGGFQMDQRSGRLYRGCMTGNVGEQTLFNVFAPALRDEAYLQRSWMES